VCGVKISYGTAHCPSHRFLSPVSISSPHGSADCSLFQQPNPNLVCRSPFMSSFFWFHCVVHSFFFCIYFTLSYIYFTLICIFNFIFPPLSLVLFLFRFPLYFIFCFLSCMSCFPFDCQFQLTLQSKRRWFFFAFGAISIRLPARTPPNVRAVTVFFRHTSWTSIVSFHFDTH